MLRSTNFNSYPQVVIHPATVADVGVAVVSCEQHCAVWWCSSRSFMEKAEKNCREAAHLATQQ